jgi:hypothetical protein
MSFEPFIMYKLRCDGRTTHGQCDEVYQGYPDGDEGEGLQHFIFEKPELPRWFLAGCRSWLILQDGRVLCPRHVAAAEHSVAASIDGLPFEE